MSKKSKRASKQSKKPVFMLLLLAIAIGLGAGGYFTYFTVPASGRHTFTFTQSVESTGSADCVHLIYGNKDYCIDEWTKVYNVMDESNKAASRTQGTTVKVDFDADFHTGTKQFVGTTNTPTIFLDKVYSATATKQ